MTRPNILLIISDDHGYADRSALGSPDAATPHLDRLAAEGLSYDNAYVTAPVCSPSRAGLITGQYQQRWGAFWFANSSFPTGDQPVMPEVLRAQGYRTGYFGKVHYGQERPGDRACPENHGFDESFYGMAALSSGRLHYMVHSREELERRGPEYQEVHGVSPMYHNGEETDCHRHLTTEFAERAIDFMTDDDKPFFCMVAFNAVHNFNWQLPQSELDARALPRHEDYDPDTDEYLDWYDGSISPNLENGRGYYLAQLEIMDREIGRMLDHLEATGQRDNTIIVYLTDNGGSPCNYGYNEPLHGTKYSVLEGGVRVPFIVAGPDVPQGEVRSALVSALDLLPTFATAAGCETLPPTDGRALQETWAGESPGHEELHFDTEFQWAVRTADWKLRWVEEGTPFRERILKNQHTDIGTGFTLVPIGESVDEGEGADVSAEHPEVVADLLRRHEEWRAEVDASAAS